MLHLLCISHQILCSEMVLLVGNVGIFCQIERKKNVTAGCLYKMMHALIGQSITNKYCCSPQPASSAVLKMKIRGVKDMISLNFIEIHFNSACHLVPTFCANSNF